MPFIHIKSAGLDPLKQAETRLDAIISDFSSALDIDPEHVTVTWEYLQADHCRSGADLGRAANRDSSTLLVDLLAPDFNSTERIETMLNSLAESLSRHGGVRADAIFINYREAHSGRVYDGGEIVTW